MHQPTRAARAVAVLALAATLPLTAAAPAHAEGFSGSDPADATGSPTDIRRVSVNHAEHRVYVTIKFTDLQTGYDNATSSAIIYVDTRRGGGPERGLGIPLFAGADYAVSKVREWRQVGGPLLRCRASLRLVPERNVARAWVGRGCLGRPARVRVGVTMVDWHDGSHVVRDWFKGYRRLTPWLARG